MGLDMWYQADVARLLAAQEEATAEMEGLGINPEYIAGRRSHARAVAAAFGLPDPAAGAPARRPASAAPVTVDGAVAYPEACERWVRG